jgi:hypothetical protein
MIRSALLLALLGFATGCQNNPPTTPNNPPPQRKTDVHIETPRGNVDVHGEGKGKSGNTDVDVHRKDR